MKMMGRWRLLLCFVLLIITVRSNAQQPTLRIMPLGDSITVGSEHVPGAYRPALSEDLEDAGYSIEFVGSSTINSPSSSLSKHEGHRQWRIRDIHEYIGQFLDEADPDIILLMIGTTDMSQDDDVENAKDRLDDLIQKIAEIRPFSYIIVSNVLYRVWDFANDNIETYLNPYVENVVDIHASMGRRVSFIDMNSLLGEERFPEDLFPDQDGYDQLGREWSAAIQSAIGPNGDDLKPSILRIRGSLDRRHFTVTFNKPISTEVSEIDNIFVDGGLSIYFSDVDDTRRLMTVTTSEQTPGFSYEVTLLEGVITSIFDIDYNGPVSVQFTVGWRFLSLSDLHVAEKYVFRQNTKEMANDKKIAKLLRENYGGDFIMITGDTNAGFWDRESHRKKMSAVVGTDLTPQEAVLVSGDRCYSGIYSSFREGGFHKLVMAYGDHEAGDNAWPKNSLKSKLQPQFRQTFARNFNFDYDGNFIYDTTIGDAAPRPFGSNYEETSYAFIHENTLIVTIDVLYQKSYDEKVAYTGTVTGEIEGKQLEWFEDVLTEGRNHPSVKHIFVQGHFPVLFPVRKVKSSGMYMNREAEAEFWQLMKKHKVDIYFAGEVHLNTVTKDPESDLIQIASRGNYFSSFLTIDVTDDTVDITCFEEYGHDKVMYNYQYRKRGRLLLTKGDDDHTRIKDSWGELQLMDRLSPVIHFSFEDVVDLWKRPVMGLGGLKSVENVPVVEEVIVDGVTCSESLPNMGSFGTNYDAQVANLHLVDGIHGKAAEFVENSRMAVWGMGPHSGGRSISYALWFATTSKNDVILIGYEGFWTQKSVMNLRLQNGRPELCYSSTQKVVAADRDIKDLNDGEWHHAAVSFPEQDCLVSEIKMYIDGVNVSTELIGDDDTIHFPNGGVLSVGGFGHGRTSKNAVTSGHVREGFTDGDRFVGFMDDVFVWSHSISNDDVRRLVDPPVGIAIRTRMSHEWEIPMCIGLGGESIENARLWPCDGNDATQHWLIDSSGFIHNKQLYSKCLAPFYGDYDEGARVVLINCDDGSRYDLSWNFPGNSIQYGGDTSKYMTVTEGREKELMLSSFDTNMAKQKWDYLQSSSADILTQFPSTIPSIHTSDEPSLSPSDAWSSTPSDIPTTVPSYVPSLFLIPSIAPSDLPSPSPTTSEAPSSHPSSSTSAPSQSPTSTPTLSTTTTPSAHPFSGPSNPPTVRPSFTPSLNPSIRPTHGPSETSTKPSLIRSSKPTFISPSTSPTYPPSGSPSKSFLPSHSPTSMHSETPTWEPSQNPTSIPSKVPTPSPTMAPTATPTMIPSTPPTPSPTAEPSSAPSNEPSLLTESPSSFPSYTPLPSSIPSVSPSDWPTLTPSDVPSDAPSHSSNPSTVPSVDGTLVWVQEFDQRKSDVEEIESSSCRLSIIHLVLILCILVVTSVMI